MPSSRVLKMGCSIVMVVNAVTVLACLIVLLPLSDPGDSLLLDNYQFEMDNNPVKTVPQLIESFGYPVEEHEVTTEDGYILTLHRIPHGLDAAAAPKRRRRSPVFLGHCLVGSSAIWAFGPRDNSLAFMLADAGYDVWMNNIRGNSYSKRHTRLDPCPTCTDFWAFGFDESSRYDYPATIDHILQQTGHESLYFVGYSMGTTQYLVLLAERPEYNDKIAAGFLLGPTAILGNATNPMVKLADQAEIFQSAAQLVGMDEFMPNFLEVKSRLSHKICHASYLHARMCRNIFALLVGSDPSGLDPATVPTYMSQLPAGASTTTFVHFAQLFRNGGRFSKFDHGTLKNLMIYGSSEAPEYDLAKVTAPTTLYVGDADGFATENDTRVLASKLPNLVSHKVVAKFSHLDFIFSIDAGKLVYAGIIDDLDTRDDEHYCHHPSSCDEI